MKKWFRYLFYLVAFLALAFAAGRLYYRLTDGFRMSNIAIELPYGEEWETHPLSVKEKAVLDEAIHQPYTYFDKGHQAYVFESRDGKFVLKLLKFQRVRIPEWLRKTSLPFAWEEWRTRRIEKKDRMLNSLLLSWKLGFDELKDEAAIVYAHINKSNDLRTTLTLYDKMGFSHKLDLDNNLFLIQRKTPLLGPTLDQLMSQGKIEDAKALLDRLVALFVSEYRRGLAEKELFILRNTGVWQGQPIHIDTGRFEWDFALIQPENYKSEIRRKTVKLVGWLKEHYPELADHLERRIREVT